MRTGKKNGTMHPEILIQMFKYFPQPLSIVYIGVALYVTESIFYLPTPTQVLRRGITIYIY